MSSSCIIPFPANENNDMPANILNLAAYTVTSVTENEHDYHISAEAKQPPTNCPHCRSDNLVGFGRREQMVRDLPMHGRRVGLYVDTRRFRCRACEKTFYESLPDIDEKRLMTKRLADWMGRQAIKRTNSRPKFERKSKADSLKAILDWKGEDEMEGGQIGLARTHYFEMSRVTPKPPPKVPSTQPPEPPKNYGVDISTLARMIENGEL